MNDTANLAALLEAFFTQRLMLQRRASTHTIAAYRDTFRLLLRFVCERERKAPSDLSLDSLNATVIGQFLEYLEKTRRNSIRSRNLRLAAIHSFFHYVAFEHPERSSLIQRVLAIPTKKYRRALVDFLTPAEVQALLYAPDRTTWGGRRDHALMAFAVQTGLRVSELIALSWESIHLGVGPRVYCEGKGRKERCTPLTKETVAIMRAWLREQMGESSDPLFPNARGGKLSNDGVQYILSKHVAVAQRRCESLKRKRVTPHVLRHTTAMNLLQSGVDRTVIALWLGHESPDTTYIYIDANMALKEEILKKTSSPKMKANRYHPEDRLLAFLRNL